MSFIKHGDGKIVSIIDEEDLTKKQKKVVKDASKETVKESNNDLDSSKNSGR